MMAVDSDDVHSLYRYRASCHVFMLNV